MMETVIAEVNPEKPDEAVIQKAGKMIRNGALVAFPTETVYGLGACAFDRDAARKIYEAKGRPSDNPLIVHIARINDLYEIASEVTKETRVLVEKLWPGPLTIIVKKDGCVPDEITGGLDTVAVRFPSNITARKFIAASGGFVAAPSANISGRPSTTSAAHVREDMDGRIDMIIDAGDCEIGLESTIIDMTVTPPVILRPGYYEKAVIEGLIGPVINGTEAPGEKDVPKAPGMKYRHYAPKAALVLVSGKRMNVAAEINRMVLEKQTEGLKTAVICADENKDLYDCENVTAIGAFRDEDVIARRLFGTLRDLDDRGVDQIFSETFNTERLGDAIMNRLMKAAGQKVIKV